MTLAGLKIKVETAKRKTPKGGTKRAFAPGRPRRLGRPREKLPSAGDVKNDTAGL
jgi:hypothetical protein